MSLFDEALADLSVAFRLVNVAIPVSIIQNESPDLALRSDCGFVWLARFFSGRSGGFTLTVTSADDSLSFELFRLKSVRHCGATVSGMPYGERVLEKGFRMLQSRLMSPNMELT